MSLDSFLLFFEALGVIAFALSGIIEAARKQFDLVGVVMIGKRWVRWRSISKEADPDPIMMPARSSRTGTDVEARFVPVSIREVRCLLRF